MSEIVDAPAEETDLRNPVWNRALVWSTLGLVGWLAFELTAQPAVAAAVVCSRFGWNHIRTAVWLWRYDWNRGRSFACLWFVLAAGVTRVVVFAFLLTILFSTFAVARGGGGAARPANANAALPAIFIGPLILMNGWTARGVQIRGHPISAKRCRGRCSTPLEGPGC
jgi:hypothetical protein